MEDLYELEGKGYVSIWVGNFNSFEEFDEYMVEKIGEDDDASTPINRFSADIGFGFYDHDFQEADFFGEKMSVRELLAPFSNADSFLENAAQAADKLQIEQANSAILLFDYNYDEKKMSALAPIKFVGSFPYEKGKF